MNQKIQLIHPDGKNAVNIEKEKYDLIKKVILSILKSNGETTHAEILNAITEDFNKNKIKFKGSINWYLEWVKLDLEARKEIKRVKDQSTVKFNIT
jgi:hypothetical protein